MQTKARPPLAFHGTAWRPAIGIIDFDDPGNLREDFLPQLGLNLKGPLVTNVRHKMDATVIHTLNAVCSILCADCAGALHLKRPSSLYPPPKNR